MYLYEGSRFSKRAQKLRFNGGGEGGGTSSAGFSMKPDFSITTVAGIVLAVLAEVVELEAGAREE